MDESIIAIIAAVAIGIFQLVTSANKKKRERERIIQKWTEEEQTHVMNEWEALGMVEMEEEMNEAKEVAAPQVIQRLFRPEEEGGPMAKPVLAVTEEEEESPITAAPDDEMGSLWDDFTPQKAVLFSEVLNPKWNS